MGQKKIIGVAAFLLLSTLALSSSTTKDASFISFKPIANASGVDVQIDTDCAGSDCGTSTIANSNTTRKLAVSSNGTIYVLFTGYMGSKMVAYSLIMLFLGLSTVATTKKGTPNEA